jgi:hypothetical protein
MARIRKAQKRTEHAWKKDKKCAPLVLAAWDRLTTNTARGVPSELRGIAQVQERFNPNQAEGLRVLVRHAQEIVNGQRKPYQLSNC